MGSCCFKQEKKTSEDDFRNNLKNDFAWRLRQINYNHLSKVKDVARDLPSDRKQS